jgi:SAM-dependent methyltransferase
VTTASSGPSPVPTPVTACPGCGGAPLPGGVETPFAKIWSALEVECGVRLPAEVVELYTPCRNALLASCSACGLAFFQGALPGGPDFYMALDGGPGYYNTTTWEGRFVVSRLASSQAVVDFGCGDGVILRQLGRRTGRTVGVDHNPDAIAVLAAAGIEAHATPFEEFAADETGSFDVVLAMQVLEHVPDVRPLMESARRVLRPGGRFFVAVPNAEREVERFEPLDFPPHHVTRWTPTDLTTLAAHHGFDVIGMHCEPDGRGAVRRSLKRRLPGAPGDLAARVIARALPARSLSRALSVIAPGANTLGHTLLAELAPGAEVGKP